MEPWALDEVLEIYAEVLARITFLNRHTELPYEIREQLMMELGFDLTLLSDIFKLRLIKEDKRPFNDRRYSK